MIPWAVIFQMAVPAGLEVLDFIVGLVQKEAKGTSITPEDWRQLGLLHASKTAKQDLAEGLQRAGLA